MSDAAESCPESRAGVLAGLCGLFGDEVPGLAEECLRACEDPDHEPASPAVAVMLSLFPALAPEPAPAFSAR